jgi:integrase
MYSQKSNRRSQRGSVQVKNSKNWLQLVFTHGGKRHYVSLGIRSNPLNRKLAKDKAFEIERDLEYGEFDPTYQKYQVGTTLTTVDPISELPASQTSLSGLWQQYVDARKTGKSPATIRMYGWVKNHLERCPHKSPNDYQSIFDWLTANVPDDSTKRLLMHLSACCKWAKRSKLVGDNPFESMAAEIKLKKVGSEDIEIQPSTREERDRIIVAFETNRYYKHYAPLIKFLFFTGCRPSEALGLPWKNIGQSAILFDRAVVYDGKGLVLKMGLKTQKTRKFPINAQLQNLIESLSPENLQLDDLVFPSPKQKFIDWGNFTTRAWQVVLDSLEDIDYRNPYQTRHTFCSLCREVDISSLQIAKWVGNSPAIIDRVYAKPTDHIQVPEL